MARQAKYKAETSNPLPVFDQREKKRSGVPSNIMGPRILLLLSALALLLIGLVMVYSSSSIEALDRGVSTEHYLIRQFIYAIVGVIGCIALWKFIPYHLWLGPFVWVVWGLSLLLLLLTAFTGETEYGAQRWVEIGGFGLQPSEFAKIAFLLMAARILFNFRNGDLDFKDVAIQAFILIMIPLVILYRTQSDLGTTLICLVGIIMIMWLGEVPLKIMLLIVAAGIAFAVMASLVGYRQDRFVFLNPWNDGANGLGTGYQLVHSFYAFAEGGLFGVGLGNSREKFQYLIFPESDFIFAIIGEELGMIGAMLVIILFLLFLYAGIRVARNAPDSFGTLLAGGFTAMLVFQAFLNIGCVIGVLPTTGKPLPFISSGGSSLIASLFMLGIILSVSQGFNAPSIHEQRRADLRVVSARRSPSDYSSGHDLHSEGKDTKTSAWSNRASSSTGSRSSSSSRSNSRSRRR